MESLQRESAEDDAIVFYFDFASPYAYLASTQMDGLAERTGRSIVWRPMMLGAAMKLTGALLAGVDDPAVKETLKRETDRAIARGVFGAPFFLVDGEPFWGVDRLPHLERWLLEG